MINSNVITVTIPHKRSLVELVLKNKKPILIGFSVSLIAYGLGMISGAYIQNAITQAGLASCPGSQETGSPFYSEPN